MNKVWINHPAKPIYPSTQRSASGSVGNHESFAQVLDHITKNQDIKFSKHALQRLKDRCIQLKPSEMSRIQEGLTKASQKGIKETLIIMDNKAFVANVPNRTIITATLEEQLKENVFTNIDGAVIV